MMRWTREHCEPVDEVSNKESRKIADKHLMRNQLKHFGGFGVPCSYNEIVIVLRKVNLIKI